MHDVSARGLVRYAGAVEVRGWKVWGEEGRGDEVLVAAGEAQDIAGARERES